MKRVLSLIAVLSCMGPIYQRSASARGSRHMAPAPLTAAEQARKEQIALDVIKAIQYASQHTGTWSSILYAHWRTESSALWAGSGNCYAYDQYGISAKWHPRKPGKMNAGDKNLAALQKIAQVIHQDVRSIRSSCGTATWAKNTGYFGGALGPMQIMADSWMSDPEVVQKGLSPLLLGHALYWAGRADRTAHDKAMRSGLDDAHAWVYAIRKYFGAVDHPMSKTYYSHAYKHHSEWRKSVGTEQNPNWNQAFTLVASNIPRNKLSQ
jgi:hypothetical protein